MLERRVDSLAILQFPVFDGMPLIAAHTTRMGGVSRAPFDSLNVGFRDGDDPENVRRNRLRVCAAVGVDADRIVAAQQCHRANVAAVSAADAGRGTHAWTDGFPGTDGLATDAPGVPLLVVSADCLLVGLASADPPAIAAVHASWRSTAGGILARAVSLMRERYGAKPETMHAALGPHISAEAYEVKEDMRKEFEAAAGPSQKFFAKREGKMFFSLEKAAAHQLTEAGVRLENIELSGGACTFGEKERFFSHRRDGSQTGRQGMIMMLKEGK
jgi:polyphenol oxidase